MLFVAILVLLGSLSPAASHIDPNDPNHHDFGDERVGELLDDQPANGVYGARVETHIKPIMRAFNIPNATLAIGQDDEVVYHMTIDINNAHRAGDVLTGDVRGRIASLSKSITGAAIL